jgi:hypothetical protein
MSTLTVVNNLGLLYSAQGKLKEAEEISYLHTHEEVLGSGESRDKHVTTPTTVLRVGACVSIRRP